MNAGGIQSTFPLGNFEILRDELATRTSPREMEILQGQTTSLDNLVRRVLAATPNAPKD